MLSLLLAAASGVLFALSLPRFSLGWLAWFALAPLFTACVGRRWLESAGLALVAGFACALVHLGPAGVADGTGFGRVPFLCIGLLLAVAAVVAGISRRAWQGWSWVVFVACAGVGLEWLTTFTPLPLNLALSQADFLPLIQVSAITGIWGVSFLVWWMNAAVADAFLRRRPGVPLMCGAVVTLLIVGGGHLTVERAVPQNTPRLRVAAIQEEGSDPSASDRVALTRQAVARGARLVVWSELCLGTAFSPEDPADPTRQLARNLNAHLVVGYAEAGNPKGHNAAALVDGAGEVRGIHRKVHPFLSERREVIPGRETKAFETGMGWVGVEICFDSCYTAVSRGIVGNGARLIAMPNYDPPATHWVIHHFHRAVLPFRAVENRVPFVRADPTGFSQIVDAAGRTVALSPLGRAEALVAEVPLGDGRGTGFTRWGDWFAALCLLVVAGFAVDVTRRWALARRKGRQTDGETASGRC